MSDKHGASPCRTRCGPVGHPGRRRTHAGYTRSCAPDLAALNLAAAQRNATISDVVRDALRMYLAQDAAVRGMPLIDAAVERERRRAEARAALAGMRAAQRSEEQGRRGRAVERGLER